MVRRATDCMAGLVVKVFMAGSSAGLVSATLLLRRCVRICHPT
jgi:hypothetical protein